jgi:hypothetical protein
MEQLVIQKAFGKVSLWILLVGTAVLGMMKLLASFLSPARKSEAREQVEKLEAEIDARQAARAAETAARVEAVQEETGRQLAADPVDIANEIIRRN